ncbi:GGDEF domain-containing protein [Vibrio sp. PP-XX7]
MSDKKSLEFKLKRESTIDPLTGVFNRRYFMNMLANVFDSCLRKSRMYQHSYVDFDLFKQINDQYGHDVGDEVLKQVAAGMRRHLRRTDTLARVGEKNSVLFYRIHLIMMHGILVRSFAVMLNK